MRSQYNVAEPGGYFMTATILEWRPVFTTVETCDIIVRALAHYQSALHPQQSCPPGTRGFAQTMAVFIGAQLPAG